ncbi:MAG: hypothetical protein M3463_12615 [Verrucomicrobiota bacterium]|nr:hypothetical protein [Verrucomicrobiota bacterium]
MQLLTEAEENLRIIRSLMERATIYRAIAAPSALVGGTLSLLAGLLGSRFLYNATESQVWFRFLLVWLPVLLVTGAFNTWFLWKEARQRGHRFISPGMKLALVALSPSFLTAALLTIVFVSINAPVHVCVIAWMLCYGLALLSTRHFAPASVRCLGWAFLLAGWALLFTPWFSSLFVAGYSAPQPKELYFAALASQWMAFSFGLFHLVYAVSTWPRKADPLDPGTEPRSDV